MSSSSNNNKAKKRKLSSHAEQDLRLGSSPIKNSKPSASRNFPSKLHDANVYLEIDLLEAICREWKGKKFLGARVAKPFGGKTKKWYYGSIDKYYGASQKSFKGHNNKHSKKQRWWHVRYDDGDQEDMQEHELSYWLKQYNLLWDKELRTGEIPYQEENEETSNSKFHRYYYKVTWGLERKITQFARDEDQHKMPLSETEREAMLREVQVHIPPTQKKQLFASLSEANGVALEQFQLLSRRYDIAEEDLDERAQKEAATGCKSWKWSYWSQDDYSNTVDCEGYAVCVQVKATKVAVQKQSP